MFYNTFVFCRIWDEKAQTSHMKPSLQINRRNEWSVCAATAGNGFPGSVTRCNVMVTRVASTFDQICVLGLFEFSLTRVADSGAVDCRFLWLNRTEKYILPYIAHSHNIRCLTSIRWDTQTRSVYLEQTWMYVHGLRTSVKGRKKVEKCSAFVLFVRFRALRLSCLRRAGVRSSPRGCVFDSRRPSGPQVPLSVYNNNPVIALGSHVYKAVAYLPCPNFYPFVPRTAPPANFHFRKARQIGSCQIHQYTTVVTTAQ